MRLLPLLQFEYLFAREKPDFQMYLGFSQKLYIMLLLTKQQMYRDNVIIRKKSEASEGASADEKSLQISIVPVDNPGQEGVVPGFVKEYILRNNKSYPVGNMLDSIFIGKGGLCIAADETEKIQEVCNLLKFTRELAGLLQEEKP